jgi:hypothetical protein
MITLCDPLLPDCNESAACSARPLAPELDPGAAPGTEPIGTATGNSCVRMGSCSATGAITCCAVAAIGAVPSPVTCNSVLVSREVRSPPLAKCATWLRVVAGTVALAAGDARLSALFAGDGTLSDAPLAASATELPGFIPTAGKFPERVNAASLTLTGDPIVLGASCRFTPIVVRFPIPCGSVSSGLVDPLAFAISPFPVFALIPVQTASQCDRKPPPAAPCPAIALGAAGHVAPCFSANAVEPARMRHPSEPNPALPSPAGPSPAVLIEVATPTAPPKPGFSEAPAPTATTLMRGIVAESVPKGDGGG